MADTEPVLDRHRARTGKRAVPAHRIAEGRNHVIFVAVDTQIVERGRGVDQRRRDVAAHMHPDAEAVGGVEFADGRLTALAALRIEIRDQVCEARAVEPRDTAELALAIGAAAGGDDERGLRSEEHTSELQSLMRISYAVFCLKKK